MLDSVTKKRIDNLRNILVGKIPSPQSQVEQITTGLVYKFMYDMDNEAIEMGGVPSFFVDKFEKYSWKHLFNSKIGGVEKVKLYSEAIENLYNNPNAPSIFREIFKNAFLPFKDPSTLNMFLKEINGFNYSNSEKLGDAYEYLLSFMGSQGDAGQFRTPRHIIDFIVEIVNPQKNETILDPACGTSGFLISSYKHILTQNTESKIGDKLNASERKQIGDNLVGYDIDPAMSKISLVNMYLHKFTSPNISEYDTLSSDEKWNEYFDIIIANPPFFSPTGGIKPHSKFGLQSTRAEVLFVDYIMDHLKPNGRAGIIVPEGIMFQTKNVYKTLRKKLVEDSLIGVISLPAGVFLPYSGVKTSILILDKKINQISNNIFFAKVENDGFALGSQRTPIPSNDLPDILASIRISDKNNKNFDLVKKEDIFSNENFLLLQSRYSETSINKSDYDLVPVVDTFYVLTPPTKIKSKDFLAVGRIPIIDQSLELIAGYWNNVDDCIKISNPVIVFGDHTKVVKFVDYNFVAGADGIKILCPKTCIIPKYLFYVLKSLKLPDLGYSRHFKELKLKKIPLPTKKVQQKIVDELDSFQKIVDGCSQIIDNYKPTFDIDPSWEMIALGQLIEISRGGSPRPIKEFITNGDGINWIKIGDATSSSKYIYETKEKITFEGAKKSRAVKNGDFILSNSMSFGRPYIMRTSGCIHDGWLLLKYDSNQIKEDFLYYMLSSQFVYDQFKRLATGGVVNNLNKELVSSVLVPKPNLEEQEKLIKVLEKERDIIQNNIELSEIYTKKIANKVNKVLGLPK